MKSLQGARLYGIIDLGYLAVEDVVSATEQLLAGGVDLLQLRAKGVKVETIASLAHQIHSLTWAAGIPLILNDHAELLTMVPAEGVHLGQDDPSIEEARTLVGRPILVGKSTHSPAQAVAAEAEGADYLGFGPLFATPTKPGRPAIGLAEIGKVSAKVRLPVFCIGGIKLENLGQVRAAGARRIVMVSGWLQAKDIAQAVRAAGDVFSSSNPMPEGSLP